jgi:hypothetical protein
MPKAAQRQIWGALVRWRWLWLAVALLALFAAINWSGAPGPDQGGEQSFVSRAELRERGAVTVRAAVLTDDESERYFGASLADQGMQAIWLSVTNASDSPLQFLPIVTDPNYFSESEVERLLRSWWRRGTNAAITAAVERARMPDLIREKQTGTGFVFTHREGGLKLFTVGFETGAEELLFKFALPILDVRGVSYAIQKVDFGSIYPPGAIEAVDLPSLRQKLAKLPCCTTNKNGDKNGDPLNIVIVGRGLDTLFSFVGRGWKLDEPFDIHSTYRTIQAFLFRNEYLNAPVSPLQVFGRQQEVALQKARDNISLRNHLRLWLTPFTTDGQQVWIGQISRDIGIKLTTQVWYLTTHRISPDVDQDRFYLLQDLIMSGAVSRFGYVQGVGISTMPNPRANLGGDPYLTDGLRLVVFLGTPPRALDRIELLDWEHPRR